jgi:hypothetical protein
VGKNHYDAIVDERALNEAKVLGELNSQDIYEHRMKTIEAAPPTGSRAGAMQLGSGSGSAQVAPLRAVMQHADGVADGGIGVHGQVRFTLHIVSFDNCI